MFKKKRPVLTATTCNEMEKVRTTLEVLSGERTCVIQIDFNTGRGKFKIGDKEAELAFFFPRDDLLSFRIDDNKWHTALFEESGEVKIGCDSLDDDHKRETAAGTFTMRWVGTTAHDRREEPLFLADAEYCAKVRGLTLEQLMNTRQVLS